MEAKLSLPEDTQNKILAELQRGEESRSQGNHGMERVCARRAVGWAVMAYYQQEDNPPSSSAFNAIRTMIDDEGAASEIRNMLTHFVQRLEKDSPDGDSYWPLDVDLIVEARKVIKQLYG
jgi:hypothetical protein